MVTLIDKAYEHVMDRELTPQTILRKVIARVTKESRVGNLVPYLLMYFSLIREVFSGPKARERKTHCENLTVTDKEEKRFEQ